MKTVFNEDFMRRDFVYKKPWGMLFGKKQYCPMCAAQLETEKVKRTITASDRDYSLYHERGTYPRRDVEVTSHRYKCPDCNRRYIYDDQIIVSMIQRKLKKVKLTEEELSAHYAQMWANAERKRRLDAILLRLITGVLCSVILWFMISGTPAADNPVVRAIISSVFGTLLVCLSILFTRFRHRVHNYKDVVRLERLHTYSRSNRCIISRVERCYCFNCMQTFKSEEISNFLATEDTALCPSCGIDSVLPDVSGESITTADLTEMHEYWF